MKTIREIKTELNEINTRIVTQSSMGTREKNAMTKRVLFLKTCIQYLESYPNEQYLDEAIDKVERKITNRMLGFELPANADNQPKGFATKLKRDWEVQMGIPHLREQVRALRFLMS